MGKKKTKSSHEKELKEWSELTLRRKILVILIVLAMILMLIKSFQIPMVRDAPVF